MESYAADDYPATGRAFERRTVRTVITNPNRLPGTWVTAEGVVIQIAEMKNSHLRNTIDMLRRESLKRLAKLAEGPRQFERNPYLFDTDERSFAAWGDVYHELLEEALFRSDDGDVEKWLAL
jgi:hypothetical protein